MQNSAPIKPILWSIFLIFATSAFSSTLNAHDALDQGYADMYNLRFEAAHTAFHNWEVAHPDDPMGPVSNAAAYLFFEFDRLHILSSEFLANSNSYKKNQALEPDPQIKQHFEASLEKSEQLAQARLKQSPNDKAALFASVLRLALEADYHALVEKHYAQSLSEIKAATAKAGDLLSRYPDCYDANLAFGVENYLLSQKPAPIRWLLRLGGAKTDLETGLAKLHLVATKGHYLKPYAKILLAIAALRSNNTQEAKELLSGLAKQFPHNDLFRAELKKID